MSSDMTWLPIELAPKDGTAILAVEGSDFPEGGTAAVVRFWDGQWWIQGAHACYIVPDVWQHIPQCGAQTWGPVKKGPLLVVVPSERKP
jgi:hypothetical protein